MNIILLHSSYYMNIVIYYMNTAVYYVNIAVHYMNIAVYYMNITDLRQPETDCPVNIKAQRFTTQLHYIVKYNRLYDRY